MRFEVRVWVRVEFQCEGYGLGFGFRFRFGLVLVFWFGLGLGPAWWLGAGPSVLPVLTFLLLGPLSSWILSTSSLNYYECPQEQGGRSGVSEGLPRSCASDNTEKGAPGHCVRRTGMRIPSISLGTNTVPFPAVSPLLCPILLKTHPWPIEPEFLGVSPRLSPPR